MQIKTFRTTSGSIFQFDTEMQLVRHQSCETSLEDEKRIGIEWQHYDSISDLEIGGPVGIAWQDSDGSQLVVTADIAAIRRPLIIEAI